MDRRRFVLAASAGALSGLAWLRAGGKAAFGATLSGPAQANAVFAAIVTAVLPFEDPRFPKVDPAAILARTSTFFTNPGDGGLFEASLLMFDDLALFESPPPILVAQETALYGAPDLAAEKRRFDVWSSSIENTPARFTDLTLPGRRTYLNLWAASAFGIRRRLYQTLKTIVVASAYSMPEVWGAIDYEGPLVPEQRA